MITITILRDMVNSKGIVDSVLEMLFRLLSSYNSVSLASMIVSISVFLTTITIQEKHITQVNSIGSTILGIYFFHETYFIRTNEGKLVSLCDIIRTFALERGFLKYDLSYPSKILCLSFVIFVLGTIIEKTRQTISPIFISTLSLSKMINKSK